MGISETSAISRAVQTWVSQLVDVTANNPLLYFRHTKARTLDLSGASADAVQRLLDEDHIKLSSLFHETNERDAAGRRAKSMNKLIKSMKQEQGLSVGHLAFGSATWTAMESQPGREKRAPCAPVALVNAEFEMRSTGSDLTLSIADEVQLNPVLSYYFRERFGIDLQDLSEPVIAHDRQVHIDYLMNELRRRASEVPGFELAEELKVVGLFSYAKLPIVQDLLQATDLIQQHAVVRALAGDSEAKGELLTLGYNQSGVIDLDELKPERELLVLDADSSQSDALHLVLSGAHSVVKGPPGTGKSQLIACLLAELSAAGKRTLFVAEKRAAIDAVMDRLSEINLDEIVFDLHSGVSAKNRVAQQIAQSIKNAGDSLPVSTGSLYQEIPKVREELQSYVSQLHDVDRRWGLSPYEVTTEMEEIGLLDRVEIRFTRSELRNMDKDEHESLREALWSFFSLGGSTLGTASSPWASAEVDTPEQVSQIQDALIELDRSTVPEMTKQLRAISTQLNIPHPGSVAEWKVVLELLQEVSASKKALGEDIFDRDIEIQAWATSSWRERRRWPSAPKLGLFAWYKVRKEWKNLRPAEPMTVTNHLLKNALTQSRQWQEIVGESPPQAVTNIDAAVKAYQELHELWLVISVALSAHEPSSMSEATLQKTVRALNDDGGTLQSLPKLRSLDRRLRSSGLVHLLEDLRRMATIDADEAIRKYRWAWLSSILREMINDRPALGLFKGQRHTNLVQRYRELDKRARRLAALRVSRRTHERLIATMNEMPDQHAIVRREAAKSRRHISLRQLVTEAEDVLFAARPCWAMSPLVVSQLLPATKLFDVVIFDEASQVRPSDAITSIMRGRQIVVAGDERQLPPSTFFERVLTDDSLEEEDEIDAPATSGMESVLTALLGVLPESSITSLRWHYRSADERLIAFSNHYIYKPNGEELVTFPAPGIDKAITHHQVDRVAPTNTTDSSTSEIDEVVNQIVNHAQQFPSEGLGIITLGLPHAERVQAAVERRLADSDVLSEFIARHNQNPRKSFFVKNIETVQGDERDAIIFSLGRAKDPDGRLRQYFTGLNYEGGERRLNVAVTRASRRMKLISSFGSDDLNPKDAKHDGVRLLRDYVRYAEEEGSIRESYNLGPVAANPFEDGVATFLDESGVSFERQYGAGRYKLDFALYHPEIPGRLVLAVETDGASYHSIRSVRDRDHLRQAHLERLGWRFHRIWSTSWFTHREVECENLLAAWKEACREDESAVHDNASPDVGLPTTGARSFPKPSFVPGLTIGAYDSTTLIALVRWIQSDGRLRTNDDLVREAAIEHLGFQRLGPRIKAALDEAINNPQEADGNGTA